MTKYVMISTDEIDIRKWEIFMSPAEVEDVITYSDVFKKYLTKKINEVQAQLGNCTLQGKEATAYAHIACIKGLIDWLDKTQEAYKEFKNKDK